MIKAVILVLKNVGIALEKISTERVSDDSLYCERNE